MIPPARRHSLIIPREHGAWGLLLVPLVVGAVAGLIAGGTAWPLAPLTILVLSLFWLRTPIENWLGTVPTKARTADEFRLVRRTAFALVLAAAAALLWLCASGWSRELVWLGMIAAAAFAGQAAIRLVNKKARTAAQMVGAAGLTAVAPAAFCVVTGRLNSEAWLLWALNFLFAANQIQFVRLRIHGAQVTGRRPKLKLGRPFLAAQFVLILLLVTGGVTHRLGWLAALAFLPALWRGFAWFVLPFEPLVVRSLGKRELAHGIAFGVLLILAMARVLR
ncbi:MAG: YwiC-like family protein [Terracidiphilus sp.]|jgi:hypothetical protein